MSADPPKPWLASYQAAREASEKGQFRKAARILSGLVEQYPDKLVFRWMLGYALMDAGAPRKAIGRFKEALVLDPKCHASWGGLGHAYTKLRKWDLAEEAFRTRLSIQENANHYIFLSVVLGQKGDYLGALRCCEKAIGLRSDFSEDYLNLGMAYRDLALYDEAALALEKAIQLDPTDPRPRSELGALKYREQDLDRAEELLRSAIRYEREKDDDDAWTHVWLAVTLETMGRHHEAAIEFRAAVAISDHDRVIVGLYRKFRARRRRERDETRYRQDDPPDEAL